jgi:hypothetical protein
VGDVDSGTDVERLPAQEVHDLRRRREFVGPAAGVRERVVDDDEGSRPE